MGCEPKTEEALGKTEFVDHDRWAHSVPGITLANAITTCVILRLLKFDVSPNSHIFLMKDPSWVVIMVLLSVSRKTLSESLPCAFQSAVVCVSLRAIACLVCCFALSYPKKIFTNISSVMRRRVRREARVLRREEGCWEVGTVRGLICLDEKSTLLLGGKTNCVSTLRTTLLLIYFSDLFYSCNVLFSLQIAFNLNCGIFTSLEMYYVLYF